MTRKNAIATWEAGPREPQSWPPFAEVQVQVVPWQFSETQNDSVCLDSMTGIMCEALGLIPSIAKR